MTKMRNIAAYVLLAVYSIVFAHNVIPHHHHLENVAFGSDLHCEYEARASHAHHHDHTEVCSSHQHADGTKVQFQHAHPEEAQSHCHFEVKPVLSKTVDIVTNYLITQEQLVPVPLEELVTYAYIYYPQKLLQSYNFAVPLRAPPVFSYDQI